MGLDKIGVQAVVDNIGGYLNDINRLNKATDSSATSIEKASKSSEAMSKALAGIGKVVAGLGLTALFGEMVKSAGESELAISQLNAVIKSTGGIAGVTSKAAQDMADALQKTTRFSDETILSGESMLLTFTQIGKDVFPRATKAVLDYATKFGSVEQAAVAIGKALQDPISGVTNLRRVGVMLSAQQEKQIKDFMAVGNVAGAQAIILKELETEFGGLAVAAGQTFAGKLDILKNKFDNILEVAGGKLIPKLTDLLTVVGNFLDTLGPENTANLLLFAGAIGAIALAAGPLGTALAIILSPIGAIIAAVAALGLAFQTNFLGIRDIVTSIWNSISGPVTAVAGAIQALITNLFSGVDVGAALANLGWQIKHQLELLFSRVGLDYRIVEKVAGALGGLIDWFTQTAIPSLLAFVTDTVVPGIQSFIDTLARIWTDVAPFLNDLMNWFVMEGLPGIQSAIDWAKVNVIQPLIDVLSGIWTTVQPALTTLYNWFVTDGLPKIRAIADDLYRNVILKLASLLSEIWYTYAKPALEALAKFFRDNGPEIGRIAGVVIGEGFRTLLNIVKDLVDYLGQAIQKFDEFLKMKPTLDIGNNPSGTYNTIAALSQIPILKDFLHLPSLQSIPGKAGGGPVSAGSWSWTGEQGPELVHWGQSASIIPAALSQALSGLMASPSPVYAGASSYAYDQRRWDNSQQTIQFNGVPNADDSLRRYSVLRALGRVR